MNKRSLLLILLSVLGAYGHAQQPPQPVATPRPLTFGTGIEVINLAVSVTDVQNRYVTDLKKPDFAVFEDGVKQDLSLFLQENLPISLSLLIDGSASMADKIPFVQGAAGKFVKTLRPQDNAQIVQFNDRITTLQEFTADRDLLDGAVKRTAAGGPTALHNALYVALKELQKLKKAGELRRLAIILLSDGEDTSSLITDEQVMDLAKKTEIAIYCVSIRENRPQDRERLSFSQAVHLLTVLSRDTGGQVHFPNSPSELESVYDRIAEELRTQYSIGYVSTNPRRDGKWRRIVVRTPERSNVMIRHKLGYYAPVFN
jgi:Ca-activated chloride channel homolog